MQGKIEVLNPVYKVVYMEIFTNRIEYKKVFGKILENYPNHTYQITFKPE